jgi:hypothetical protein
MICALRVHVQAHDGGGSLANWAQCFVFDVGTVMQDCFYFEVVNKNLSSTTSIGCGKASLRSLRVDEVSVEQSSPARTARATLTLATPLPVMRLTRFCCLLLLLPLLLLLLPPANCSRCRSGTQSMTPRGAPPALCTWSCGWS